MEKGGDVEWVLPKRRFDEGIQNFNPGDGSAGPPVEAGYSIAGVLNFTSQASVMYLYRFGRAIGKVLMKVQEKFPDSDSRIKREFVF
jgi:hypothetical protein